jgi:penicillin-binding protein 2
MSVPLGPSHDAQRFHGHNRFALAVVVVGVMLLGARLTLVQVVRGERYERFAAIERVAKVRAQAPRGLIKGADGTVLARNIESHRLELLTNRIKPERIPEIAKTLRSLLDMTDAERDGLIADLNRPVDPRKRRPLVVRRDLVSTHCPYDSSQLELVSETNYGFCTTCGRYYEPLPKRRACPFDQKKLLAVGDGSGFHCASCDREFLDGDVCPHDHHNIAHGKHILRCPLCRRSFNDEVAVLRANLHRLPEARVVADIQREYPYRYLASHVLGFMGFVSRKELEALGQTSQLGLNDKVGRSGLERALDVTLRGTDGEQVLVRKGGAEEQARDLDELIAAMQPKPAVPGLSVRTTLDLELQRSAKVAMKDVYSGAVVVLDAHNGQVLVMYSKPGFDPNTLSGKRTPQSRTLDEAAAYAPLMNKAVTAFPPASVYKVVTAAAALEEGVVRPTTTFYCGGYLEFGGRRFHCYDRKGHGELDLHEALRNSCDIYFYHLGDLLGLDRLEKYALAMGFGEKTGIEISEAVGRVPNRAWYHDHVKGGYFPGFALSTAVGQKDVTTTPLQIARAFVAISTNGVLPQVSLIRGFETPDGKLTPLPPRPGRSMGLKDATLAFLRKSLVAVVNEEGGTARSARPTVVDIAGKTGTAQAAQRARPEILEKLKDDPVATTRLVNWLQNDHAWFAGYAPTENPEIVVVVFVEHGGSGGHNAAPIAKQVVEAWFARSRVAAPPMDTRKPHPAATAPDLPPTDAAPAATAPLETPAEAPAEPDPNAQPSELLDAPPAPAPHENVPDEGVLDEAPPPPQLAPVPAPKAAPTAPGGPP